MDPFYAEKYKEIQTDSTMSEETQESTDCGGGQFDFSIDDVTVDYLAEQHDGVAQLKESLDAATEKAEQAEEAAEALDLSDGQSLRDAVEVREEQIENLQARVDEYEGEELNDLIDEITERTDRWDEEDIRELYDENGLDAVEERRDLVVELTSDSTTANAGGGDETETEAGVPERQTPWN